ncbi:MAG TPA: lasso RiPP family leader peptide-containing protein [Longimicrobiales bacterium]|nr:lasso RiPP family leader peptide-containing protein [Longimicrobiales bacterium]
MSDKKEPTAAKPPEKPAAYQQPRLERWGTLRELTAGGGGNKNEPATKRQTRF